MRTNYHVHSEYSGDSSYPMEEVVKDAIEAGLDEIAFTDHVDYGIKEDWADVAEFKMRGDEVLANVNYPKYVAQIEELQEKYADKITIKLGIEFGVQTQTISKYEELFKKYPFDFVILSVHQVGNKEFWNQDYQSGKSQKEINEGYYNELLKVIKLYKNYSVLGHLDLITRYDEFGVYPFKKVKDIIETILQQAIDDGKGIEFNASYHRYGLSDTTPSREILKLYKKMGGKIVTIGTDSHSPDHLDAYIDESHKILKSLGYTEFCTFNRMQPIFHEL